MKPSLQLKDGKRSPAQSESGKADEDQCHEQFREWLTEEIERQDVSKADLARAVGIHRNNIQKVFKPGSDWTPGLRPMARIARALGFEIKLNFIKIEK